MEAVSQCFPRAEWQRCVFHFHRNILSKVSREKMPEVAAMLKAIHAQEEHKAAMEKAAKVRNKLLTMRLRAAAEVLEAGNGGALTYMSFPREHWIRIRTNNTMERLNREIRRRTRVVGNFPDGQSAVMLVAARLRHVAATRWGSRRYLDMDRLQFQKPTKEDKNMNGSD